MDRARFSTFVLRLGVAALVWWVLTDGATEWDAWVLGLPAVVAAAGISTAILPASRWSWRGAARYAVFFAKESWLGGIDVARRALAPGMPLAPGFVETPVRAASGLPQVTVINTSSLLPGSLVVDVDRHRLLVHALDAARPDVERTIDAADAKVMAMFPER